MNNIAHAAESMGQLRPESTQRGLLGMWAFILLGLFFLLPLVRRQEHSVGGLLCNILQTAGYRTRIALGPLFILVEVVHPVGRGGSERLFETDVFLGELAELPRTAIHRRRWGGRVQSRSGGGHGRFEVGLGGRGSGGRGQCGYFAPRGAV